MSAPTSPRDEWRANVYAEAAGKADRRTPNASGWYYFKTCPFCSAGPRKSAAHEERGFRCFVCGWHGADDLAATLGLAGYERPAQRPAPAPQPPKRWQRDPQAYQDRYTGHLDRVTLWRAYKPLTLESIQRFGLGVGVLPSSPCTHPRLTYANLETGQPTGFRGRRLRCDCKEKWITAGGSGGWLAGAHLLRPGARVLMVENWIDGLLCMQRWPGCVAVASTLGASGWSDAMLDLIIASKPLGVKQIGDNDHACLPNAETIRHIQTVINPERVAAGKKPLKISRRWHQHAAYLRDAGIPVTQHIWPAGTPYRYDPGSMLIDEGML